MKLNHVPFVATKSGHKTIEVRLNDERRSHLKVGDHIQFRHTENEECLSVRVVGIRKYPDIQSLSSTESFVKTGGIYRDRDDWIQSIETYYSAENQKRYGLLAIEIEL